MIMFTYKHVRNTLAIVLRRQAMLTEREALILSQEGFSRTEYEQTARRRRRMVYSHLARGNVAAQNDHVLTDRGLESKIDKLRQRLLEEDKI